MTTGSLTISELTRSIKNSLEQNPEFNQVWVVGEISNVTYHSSGHIYFTLKDENAVISATFFKYANSRISFKLEVGMSVLALGSVTVFEKRGTYQLNIQTVKPAGIGELQRRIEELKKKLANEGIFAPEQKKELPLLPSTLGIVTSPTGAAIRDIFKVALRRYPSINIIVAPAKVQGGDAVDTIVEAIKELNKPGYNVDVIIAGRGGGSFEDLMPFNEEKVVRAFASSRVPIISAVGHQVDHPLSDDAADVYAATPSHAAELAVPDKAELIHEIDYLSERIERRLQGQLNENRVRIDSLLNRGVMISPMNMITQRLKELDEINRRGRSAVWSLLELNREKMSIVPRISFVGKNLIKDKRYRYTIALQSLEQLSPLNLMSKGYSILRKSDNSVIKNLDQLSVGEFITAQMIDGTTTLSVNSINRKETHATKREE